MNELMEVLFLPAMIFVIVVCPLWIVFHYLFARGSKRELVWEQLKELEYLQQEAVTMRQRIEHLEAILDSETADWRANKAASAKEKKIQD